MEMNIVADFVEELKNKYQATTSGVWQFGLRRDVDVPASIYATGGRAVMMSPRYGVESFEKDAAFVTLVHNNAAKLIDLLDLLSAQFKDFVHFENCHFVADFESCKEYCPTCPGCTCAGESAYKLLQELSKTTE